jgi:hypothetical protein
MGGGEVLRRLEGMRFVCAISRKGGMACLLSDRFMG